MFIYYFVRVVHSGTKNKFTMPVTLSFWGKDENKNAVIEMMARRGYKLNTDGSRVTGTNTVLLCNLTSSLKGWGTC